MIVNASIQLDDQAMFSAVEIHDEAAQRMLATKLQTFEPSAPQTLPQTLLCGRHFLPQLPRSFLDCW